MIETTITICTQYPFQLALLSVVLVRVGRDALAVLTNGREGRPTRRPLGTPTARQAA
jgi:hypothetical protein